MYETDALCSLTLIEGAKFGITLNGCHQFTNAYLLQVTSQHCRKHSLQILEFFNYK